MAPDGSRAKRTDRPRSAATGFEHEWKRRFEQFAESRDDDAGIAGWSDTGLRARMRRFLHLWQPGDAGKRWLDAGCGAATYTRALQEARLDVVGVDYSLPSLQKAKARSAPGTGLVAADVQRLPFAPRSFDGVICFGVVQALTSAEPALRELGSLVRDGGVLWVDALNKWCLVHAWDLTRRRLSGRRIHLRYESPAVIRRQLRALGFENVRVHWMPIAPGRWARFQAVLESRPVVWAFSNLPLLGRLLSHAFVVTGTRKA